MHGYNITLTITQVQEAIKQSKNNNSQGPDKLSIRHLKHIGPLGLAFLTSILKTALNTNIIPHIWRLANIVRIPKQADIPHLSNWPTMKKSLLPYITATRVQNTTLYSDGTTHIKQNRSKGVQPNGSPCANNHCSTRYMSKAFDTINIHTLIKKLLQPKIPCTIIKLIEKYIRDAKPTQHIEITHPRNVNS